MVQALLDGSDTPGVLAADHIGDLFGKMETFFLYDLTVLDNIYRDIVIDKTKDIQIHKINGTFNLHNILPSHFTAPGVLDDSHVG